MKPPVFIKLGGSLITDKRAALTPKPVIIRQLAKEIKAVREADPELPIVLGHGSGSFGHWEASHYGTRQGVHTPEEWRGFSQVAAAAARLNRLVADTFLETGVPVLSLPASASTEAHDGAITAWNATPIRHALEHGLLPLIFGDVAFDSVRGGTILSTEDLFQHLAHALRPGRMLLLGITRGVLDAQGQLVPHITPATYPALIPALGGSGGVDVTGGMADKVAQMIALVQALPGLQIEILSGQEPGALKRALLEPAAGGGTWITEDPPA
jgi:isopentenyl phosphate kinase